MWRLLGKQVHGDLVGDEAVVLLDRLAAQTAHQRVDAAVSRRVQRPRTIQQLHASQTPPTTLHYTDGRTGPSDQTKSTDLSEARAVDLAKTRQSPQTCRRPVRTQRTLSETRVGERRYRCAKPPDYRRPGSPTESGRARGLVEF